MFSIRLSDCGKSFNRRWLFRQVSTEFHSGEQCAILGPNGSGKSTFTLMLAAQLLPTEGSCRWYDGDREISLDQVHHYVSLASPGMELPDEFSATELFRFHGRMKAMLTPDPLATFQELTGFDQATLRKPIGHFSSGMKQRLKLGLAIMTDAPVLILDEPFTNLDRSGETFVTDLLEQFGQNRLILVASNREAEYAFCNRTFTPGDGSAADDQRS